MKIMLPSRREHDFHKITIFTFSPLGTPKWTQNGQRLEEKLPKITKIAKKVDFLRGRFFDDFLDGQKIEKRRHNHHRGMSSPGPGLHWGTIGGTINQQPMNSLSNMPMGQRPGELPLITITNFDQHQHCPLTFILVDFSIEHLCCCNVLSYF